MAFGAFAELVTGRRNGSSCDPGSAGVVEAVDADFGFTSSGSKCVKTIRVGLTGLARAGKTMFLTAVIHNFLEHNGHSLRRFNEEHWQYHGWPARLRRRAARFPFQENLDRLQGPRPVWPEQTHEVREFALDLQFESMIEGRGKSRSCRLEFVDYPGERLIDVPLLDQEYAEWAAGAWRRVESTSAEGRDECPFRSMVEALVSGPATVTDDQFAAAGRAFSDLGRRARHTGFPIAPVEPVLTTPDEKPVESPFFPLPPDALNSDSRLVRRLRRAFDKYKAEVVVPFYH